MKIAIAKEHRDFYKKNGWIEFEKIFDEAQLTQFNSIIDQTLAERLSISINKLSNALPESLYLHSRDLWRENEQLRQMVCLPRIAEIVSELIELKPLRIGFDQVLQVPHESRLPKNSSYGQFLKEPVSLQDLSSLKGLMAGLLICLNDSSIEALESHDKNHLDIYPFLAGNITIFNPNVPLNFATLLQHSSQRYYLITYAQSSSYYLHEPNDMHLHALKKYGYSFNEKLSDRLNPIIYR